MERDLKIQIKENKVKESLNFVQYILTYDTHGLKKENENLTRENSYRIISMLKSDNDVVIEVNSSLLNIRGAQKQAYVFSLLDSLKSMGLDYRYRKMSSSSGQTILSFVIGKKEDEHEIFIYVPDSVWRTSEFQDIMPAYGAKYYIYDGSLETNECLDNLYRITDEEKLDFFKITIFDPGILERMAINSKRLCLEDLKGLIMG
jgi:hypothetical protein